MAKPKKSRREAHIEARRDELGMSWDELAHRAGTTLPTLRNIRRGGNSYPRIVRNVEAALGWAIGSIAAIDEGGEPRVVDVDAVLRRPLPAGSVGQAPLFHAPAAGDFPAQLRNIRQRMGADAFWHEIEAMDEEESTDRDRPHATG